jgi:hypothetical protein
VASSEKLPSGVTEAWCYSEAAPPVPYPCPKYPCPAPKATQQTAPSQLITTAPHSLLTPLSQHHMWYTRVDIVWRAYLACRSVCRHACQRC